jgi:ADP-ribose pyrophosphatase YjhB (NUDIX family)
MNVGADALVVDDDGRVLLVRRADDRLWAMPGGWVDAAETPEQGAVREVSRRPACMSRSFGCFTQRGGRAASISHTRARSSAASFVARRSQSTWRSITPTPCASGTQITASGWPRRSVPGHRR